MTVDLKPDLPLGLTLHSAIIGGRRVQYFSLRDCERISLFDCGLSGMLGATVDGWEADGLSLHSLVLSHADADHFGDASDLKERFPNLQIFAHQGDQRWIEDPDLLVRERYDHARQRFHFGYSEASLIGFRKLCGSGVRLNGLLRHGDRIKFGCGVWEVLHVPGHSPGHIALWETATGTLLLGDAILGLGIPDIDDSLSMPPTHQFIHEYLETIKTLGSLPVQLALTGHWPPLNGSEFRQLLADSRFCVERDLAFIRSELTESPKSFSILMASLNQRFRAWPSDQDEHYSYALAGYINYLEALGEVRVAEGDIHTL